MRVAGRRWTAALASVLLVPALAACSEDPPTPSSDPDDAVVEAIQRTLRQRARAIVAADPVRFRRTVVQDDAETAAEQHRYFDNLVQLPLQRLRYDVDADSVRRDGDGYWAEVVIRIRLAGYDAAPVLTRDRWRFTPSADGTRYLVASTTDPDWERESSSQPQPWDLADIEVREGPGVLGVFDSGTIADAEAVIDSVSQNRYAVRSVLPAGYDDPGGVVVYVLSGSAFLDSIDELPVSDPERLGGATVPVPRDAGRAAGPVASYRIVLNPDVLDEDDQVLDRLVRHELTHVAVGNRARGVPLWFSEGLAEYVSVRPILPSERRLQSDAFDLVADGVADLPDDAEFAGEHAAGWYAVAWWACEYIASNFGEGALWTLLEALDGGADQEQVIADLLGLETSDLARNAVALMRRTYA